MANITVHYNRHCPECARQAQRTAQMDWFSRVEFSTHESPLGAVPIGDIVVVDKQTRQVFTGIYATRKVCVQVPLYFLYGLLLYIPPIRAIAGRKKPGCNGDACSV
jgi:hypothetical protein